MLGHFSLGELTVLLAIVVLLFGAKRLPEVAGSFGKSIKAFKQGLKEEENEPPPDPKKN
jgi:sec-independent protein translocase protein TatA